MSSPVSERWHFNLAGSIIERLSDFGDGTVGIFGFNDDERIAEREALIATGRYPSIAALARLKL